MKRLMAVLLVLTLLCPAALGEVFCVDYWSSGEESDWMLLLRDDGTALTPSRTYRSISPLKGAEGALYVGEQFNDTVIVGGVEVNEEEYMDYRITRHVALLDGDGNQLTDFLYYRLDIDPTGAIIGKRWPDAVDVLDQQGNVVFSGNYVDIRPTGEGGWLALRQEGEAWESNNAIVAVDADGTVHETGFHIQYDTLEPFDGGLCAVAGIRELDRKATFLNARGEQAMKRTFDDISDAYGGHAAVCVDDLYGLYDVSAERYILPPVYDYISLNAFYSRPIYTAHQGVDAEVYDAATGEKLLARSYPEAEYLMYSMIGEDVFQVGADYENYELCDLSGNTLFRVQGKNDIRWGYNENDAFPQRFVEVEGEFPENYFWLIDLNREKVGPDWQALQASLWRDGHGRYVTGRFDVVMMDGELSRSWRSERSGVCDENGETILDMIYDSVRVLSLDRYWVHTADRIGMIDGTGKWYYAIELYNALMD